MYLCHGHVLPRPLDLSMECNFLLLGEFLLLQRMSPPWRAIPEPQIRGVHSPHTRWLQDLVPGSCMGLPSLWRTLKAPHLVPGWTWAHRDGEKQHYIPPLPGRSSNSGFLFLLCSSFLSLSASAFSCFSVPSLLPILPSRQAKKRRQVGVGCVATLGGAEGRRTVCLSLP